MLIAQGLLSSSAEERRQQAKTLATLSTEDLRHTCTKVDELDADSFIENMLSLQSNGNGNNAQNVSTLIGNFLRKKIKRAAAIERAVKAKQNKDKETNDPAEIYSHCKQQEERIDVVLQSISDILLLATKPDRRKDKNSESIGSKVKQVKRQILRLYDNKIEVHSTTALTLHLHHSTPTMRSKTLSSLGIVTSRNSLLLLYYTLFLFGESDDVQSTNHRPGHIWLLQLLRERERGGEKKTSVR